MATPDWWTKARPTVDVWAVEEALARVKAGRKATRKALGRS